MVVERCRDTDGRRTHVSECVCVRMNVCEGDRGDNTRGREMGILLKFYKSHFGSIESFLLLQGANTSIFIQSFIDCRFCIGFQFCSFLFASLTLNCSMILIDFHCFAIIQYQRIPLATWLEEQRTGFAASLCVCQKMMKLQRAKNRILSISNSIID